MQQANGIEIERKFLLAEFPSNIEKSNGTKMKQGYLTQESAEVELRVRGTDHDCFLTLKKGRGMLRQEEEIHLEPEEFEKLWPFTADARVHKTRYRGDYNGTTVEIDEYHDELSPLLVAEIELPPGADFLGIEIPDWVGIEITGLPEFTNQSLARHGFPKKSDLVPPLPVDNTTRPITHSGAIPYRFEGGELQILCITSRISKKWIVPKGVWDAGLDLNEVAAKETWEEAGVVGTIDDRALGIYEEDNEGRIDRVELFALAVEKQEEDWPEKSFRERRWLGFDEARSEIFYPDVAALMQKLKERLTAEGSFKA